MSNLRQTALCFGIAAVMLSGMAIAQAGQAEASVVAPDAFARINASLNDAADTILALALAHKPWMKAPSGVRPEQSSGAAVIKRRRVRAAVQRVQQLQPTIEPILREEGVSGELSVVILVKSDGLTTALSSKGALGLWQFMPDTARRYGLVVSPRRDDRLNIVKSTRAAARYLRDLYQEFGDWQLAFAAYNAGEKAVGHAMDRAGDRSFLAIESALPAETRTYVPTILSAISRMHGHDFATSTYVVYASVNPGH